MLCKLTDKNCETRGHTKWGPGVSQEATGKGELCDSGWIHFYESPLIAAFMDPVHGCFGDDAILWRVEVGDVVKMDGPFKSGTTRLTTVERIELPVLTHDQRAEIAIRCALNVYGNPGWVAWAERWLQGRARQVGPPENAEPKAWLAQAEVAAWAAETAAEADQEWADMAAAWAAKAAHAALVPWTELRLLAIIRRVVGHE